MACWLNLYTSPLPATRSITTTSHQWLEILARDDADHQYRMINHPMTRRILEGAIIRQLPVVLLAESGTHVVMQIPVKNLILPSRMSDPAGLPSKTLRLPLHAPRPAIQGHHVLPPRPRLAPNGPLRISSTIFGRLLDHRLSAPHASK